MDQEDIFDMQKRGHEIMRQNMERSMAERCGIKHGFGDQTCVREKGHDGLCRCRAERGTADGTITYSEWESRDGKFYSHVGYQTIYPANATRDTGE